MPEQRVVGDHQIVRHDLLAAACALASALQHDHAQPRREARRLARPVVHDRGRAYDERGPAARILLADERKPGERLDRLSEPHVICEHGPEPDGRGPGEEVEPFVLVGPELRGEPRGQIDARQAPERGEPLA